MSGFEADVFKSILVAVDGSHDADRALAHAIDISTAEGSALTIVTVPADFSWSGLLLPGEPGGVLLEAAHREAEAVLRRCRELIPSDRPLFTVLADPPVRGALIRQIDDGRHDLVVMGSRGRGAARTVLLGSVTSFVLHHSKVPVLVVQAGHPAPPAEEPEGRAVGSGRAVRAEADRPESGECRSCGLAGG